MVEAPRPAGTSGSRGDSKKVTRFETWRRPRSRSLEGSIAEQLVERRIIAPGAAHAQTISIRRPKSFSRRKTRRPRPRENVGGSRMIHSNLSPRRASLGSTSSASSTINRCPFVLRWFKAKLRRPSSRAAFDRSILTVRAPAIAATTENEQVYEKRLSSLPEQLARTRLRFARWSINKPHEYPAMKSIA